MGGNSSKPQSPQGFSGQWRLALSWESETRDLFLKIEVFRWIGPLPLSEERDKSVGLTDKKCHPWLHLEIGKAKCRLALLPKQNLSIPQFSFPKFKWHAFVGIRFEDIVRCSWASSGIGGQCLGSFDLYSARANQSSHIFLLQSLTHQGLLSYI